MAERTADAFDVDATVAKPTLEERDKLRAALIAEIPGWYSPWGHVLFPSVVGIAVIVGALLQLRDLRLLELLTCRSCT